MARASKSGSSHGSAKSDHMNDDQSDTTLAESLESSEVCSLTLDSNGDPASQRNLAELARKRHGCNSSPRFIALMVLGCTALAGVIAVAGWAGGTRIRDHYLSQSSSAAHTVHEAAPAGADAGNAASAAALATDNNDDGDREAEDDAHSKEISAKNEAEAQSSPAEDEFDDAEIDKEIEAMETDIVREEERNDRMLEGAGISDNAPEAATSMAPVQHEETKVSESTEKMAEGGDDDEDEDVLDEIADEEEEEEEDEDEEELVAEDAEDQVSFTTRRSEVLEAKQDLQQEFHAVENEIMNAQRSETEETKAEIKQVAQNVNEKIAKVEKLESDVAKVNKLDEKVKQLIRDEKADQESVKAKQEAMQTNLETLVDASKKLMEETQFEKKQKSLEEQREALAEQEARVADKEKVVMEEEEKLEREQSEVQKEEEAVKEIEQKQSQFAERVAEKEKQAEEMAEREEKREEEEDAREKNEKEREHLVEKIEKKVEANDIAAIDEKPSSTGKSSHHVIMEADSVSADASNSTAANGTNIATDFSHSNASEASKSIGTASGANGTSAGSAASNATSASSNTTSDSSNATSAASNATTAGSNNATSNASAGANATDIAADFSHASALDASDSIGTASGANGTSAVTNATATAANATSSNATASNATTTATNLSASVRLLMDEIWPSHRDLYRKYRLRDHVRMRNPEENRGTNVLEGDIRVSKRYMNEDQVARKSRELANTGDYVDVVEEDMAHLGIGEKCTQKQKGTNINVNDLKEDVKSYSWENGLVRYAFATNYTTEERHTILDAMNDLAELVNKGSDSGKCISYTPYDPEKDDGKEYVWFYPGEGCESPVGAPHDEANRHVSLASNCMERGVVQHELIHILGFWHEQSRTDRDKYVDIKWENIEDGICDNFKMYSDPIDDHLGLPYDLRSIMHYKSTAFSKNGQDTIVPKNGMPASALGQRDKPSAIDILKVRLRYNCTAPKDPSEYQKLLKIPIGNDIDAVI